MDRRFIDALVELQEDLVLALAQEKLGRGESPFDIMNESRMAMTIVGDKFAKGEYFLPELIFAGEILKKLTEMIKPYLGATVSFGQERCLGKVVIGTVAGDIHDIGLNIVSFMLEVNGFEVYNLGVDVPPERFVQEIIKTKAPVLGLSGFLTLAFDSMRDTVEALKAAGLRDKVKVMIGGGQVDEEVRKYVGADAYGRDAIEAVYLAKKWLGG